jgi:hypothetical protein
MKIFAVSKPGPNWDMNKVTPLLKHEAHDVWNLYKSEKIREIYMRKDHAGVVLVLEASSIEDAESSLAGLTLYKENLIRFDMIPVGPFLSLEQLFK